MSVPNSGERSTVAGAPPAKRILQHLHHLDALIARQHRVLKQFEIEERSTPRADVTAVFRARKTAANNEYWRLVNGRKYWKRILDAEVERLRQGGALDPPAYQFPEEASPGIVMPEDIGLRVPQPYFDETPTQPSTDNPTDRTCGLPANLSDKEKKAWIREAWARYWLRLAQDRETYFSQLDRWHVEMRFWEERKRKTLDKGAPFAEPAPEKPTMPATQPPNCPPPETGSEI